MESLRTWDLYVGHGHVPNPFLKRGDFVTPYEGGPLGRYVGVGPSGTPWVAWVGGDMDRMIENYRKLCDRLDGREV